MMSREIFIEALQLMGSWYSSILTGESLKKGTESSTTEKYEKIRQERFQAILPELKKEYPLFSKKVKYQKIGEELYKMTEEFETRLGLNIVLLIIYLVFCFLTNMPIKLLVILTIIIIVRLMPIIVFYLVTTKESRKEYKGVKSYLIEKDIGEQCPYTTAFLYTNGLGYEKYEYRYGKTEYGTSIHPLLLKEMKNLSFEEFINFVKANAEPEITYGKALFGECNSSETVTRSTFFYINEKILEENINSRNKIKKVLEKYKNLYEKNEQSHKNSLARQVNSMSTTHKNSLETQANSMSTTHKNNNNKQSVISKDNVEIKANIDFIKDNAIRFCASILTGHKQYSAGKAVHIPSFGSTQNDEDWHYFTKSIVESQEVYANKIVNEDLRQAARAIITQNKYHYASSIRNRDIKEMAIAIAEKDINKYRIIQNSDLSQLARVVAKYGVF